MTPSAARTELPASCDITAAALSIAAGLHEALNFMIFMYLEAGSGRLILTFRQRDQL